MVDTATVTRVTGRVLDEDTGEYVDTTSTVYSGKVRVQVRNAAVAALPLSGERQVVAMQLEVWFPISVTVRVDDRVTVTASEFDPALVGRVFRVREEMQKTHLTSRRTIVQEEQT